MKAELKVGWAHLVFAVAVVLAAVLATGATAIPLPHAFETDDSETLVDIPDAALRKAVEEVLGKDPGDPITRAEMATLQSLSVTLCSALTGIEHATNLVDFASIYGRFSNLAPLAGLTSLQGLILDGHNAEMVDLGPLARLTSLARLTLTNYAIGDIAPLAGLTSLDHIDLEGNAIVDLTPLAGLTSVRRIELSGNEIADLGPLSGLTSLEWLVASDNQIVDIGPLSSLTSIFQLELAFNQIVDIGGLVANDGIGRGDWVNLTGNPLDVASNETHIPSLFGRGVWVTADAWEISVDIPDVALREAVQSVCCRPGDRITRRNMWYLDFVRAKGVRQLTGMEHAVNIGEVEVVDGQVEDVRPLSALTNLVRVNLSNNAISDVASLAANDGLGSGDDVHLGGNPLGLKAYQTDIPMLRERGVRVHFNGPREVEDAGLRQALAGWIYQGNGWTDLLDLDAADHGVEKLNGLEGATPLVKLSLHRNEIADITPLANLADLRYLSLAHNTVADLAPLELLPLYYLALDSNSLCELSALPKSLHWLYLTDNCLSDITPLADLTRLRGLQLDGNSIYSLAPLAAMKFLLYLHVNDNQIADLSSLSVEWLRELLVRNNAVRDISRLLDGKELMMVDVRRNPLGDDALGVVDTLRERGVAVLAGERVPYLAAASGEREGFVRIVNGSDEDGHVFIEAVDDAGVRAGPMRLDLKVREAVHFNSADLEHGNRKKGLNGIGAPTVGDWRLSVISALDVEVLSYIRTEDGFVTAMHDVVADAVAPFFNPGSNRNQRSILRVVNTEAGPAKWTTGGYDDGGQWHSMTGSMLVRPQHALTLTAEALENAHGMGDGHGKWRLRVRGFPWYAMSLLESPTGHLTNLSTAPNNATPLDVDDGGYRHRLPLVPSAGGDREGFVRVVNRSLWQGQGEVAIEAVDDEGNRFGPVELALDARQTVHFNSNDLEAGNAGKGLFGGVGEGRGDWRLELTSTLDLQVLAYIRTSDGFLTSMHDLAPRTEDGDLWIPFFNPGSNRNQVSHLRLVNWGDTPARATITAIDDDGQTPGDAVRVRIPAHAARTFTAAELETGDADGLSGALGDGEGKWRLRVATEAEVDAMSLLSLPTGHMTNLSTTPRHPPRARSEH